MHTYNLWVIIITLLSIRPVFGQNTLTLEDIFASDKFEGRTISNIQWRPDSRAFTYTQWNPGTGLLDIYEHEVASGENTLIRQCFVV